MPSDTTPTQFYRPVEEFLQQGDVFCTKIVTPLVDTDLRLFRTTDGRHGSKVFSDSVDGSVFSIDEAERILAAKQKRTSHCTEPFSESPEGIPELVVVPATLTEYFIVASQTCDISGVDRKNVNPSATILQARTLKNICMSLRLPLDGTDAPLISVHDYLIRETNRSILKAADHFSYSAQLRAEVQSWTPDIKEKRLIRSQISNLIRKHLDGTSNLYYLEPDHVRLIPELSIDFSSLYTMRTSALTRMSTKRVATLADLYREDFSSKLGIRFSRVGLPKTMQPQSIL